VWKKSTSKFEAKLKEKIQETLKQIHEITKLETEEIQKETEIDEQDLKEIASELEGKVEKLTEKIEKEINPTVRKDLRGERSQIKKCVKIIREDFIPRMAKYKEQSTIFRDCNSCSKTDKDASLMRMKEDHMKNGQLKLG
jgi:hypothetical protein